MRKNVTKAEKVIVGVKKVVEIEDKVLGTKVEVWEVKEEVMEISVRRVEEVGIKEAGCAK